MKKLLFCLLVLSLVSCASKKDVLYFQDIEDTYLEPLDSLVLKTEIQPSDILYIRLTALNPASILPYQFEKGTSPSTARTTEMIQLDGYQVNKEGAINFPQLGKITVEGLTTQQVEAKLKKKLSDYIINPAVSVRIVNYKISVIGEVARPGTFTLSEEHITLPQALGLAGDLTIRGERQNVLIIRQQDGKRIHKYIDLTKSDWMNSPFYYLKQNDIVYVQPNNPKVKTAGFIGSVGNVLSVASILLSAAVIIFNN